MARMDTDLLGLQIVALDSAAVVGEIDGLLIDDATMKVAGFLVDLGLYEASVLSFGSAHAVGLDAVIVESADKITEISADPTLEALNERDIAISDAKAITRSGRSVGTIGDFFVDTENGDVVGMEFLAADQTIYPRGIAVIPASVVFRLGRDIVVLDDDYDQHFLKDGDSLERVGHSRSAEPAPVVTPEVVVAPEAATEAESPVLEVPEEAEAVAVEPAAESELEPPVAPAAAIEPEPAADADTATEVETPAAETTPTVPADDLFATEHKHFLIGKRVLRRIETPGGEVIAEEGDIVTFDTIEKAKSSDQLLILSLNVE
ncbi:MAG TPA: hypothetical protein VFD74_01725 [Thermoleophilia bacterium]|nr:hypothetical protein [Thermoleophilia bacterium]